ncbi:28S ribosomal protein S24, mitochondrial [Cyphomyrmex costatus]|uniref:28S ribosomal protein S24, mitochondrial n=1 Tax=Cyphomyrmex costatus TaxID=456900 RepID=A0A195CH82_9HYME|nr:28S ribosomal protein S24, mitochondrial [Cyphomyrmex costatus]
MSHGNVGNADCDVNFNYILPVVQQTLMQRYFHTSTIVNKVQSGRYKITINRDKPLTYEMANPPHYIAHRKSWNSWNTSRADNGFLLDGGRPANQPANHPSYPASRLYLSDAAPRAPGLRNSSALTDGQGASIVQTRGKIMRSWKKHRDTARGHSQLFQRCNARQRWQCHAAFGGRFDVSPIGGPLAAGIVRNRKNG